MYNYNNNLLYTIIVNKMYVAHGVVNACIKRQFLVMKITMSKFFYQGDTCRFNG